jgi:hypothetical protein
MKLEEALAFRKLWGWRLAFSEVPISGSTLLTPFLLDDILLGWDSREGNSVRTLALNSCTFARHAWCVDAGRSASRTTTHGATTSWAIFISRRAVLHGKLCLPCMVIESLPPSIVFLAIGGEVCYIGGVASPAVRGCGLYQQHLLAVLYSTSNTYWQYIWQSSTRVRGCSLYQQYFWAVL